MVRSMLAAAGAAPRQRAPRLSERRTAWAAALLVCSTAALQSLLETFCAPSVSALTPTAMPRRLARMARQATVDGVAIEGELVPLSSYALVKPKEAVGMSKGGILLPDSGKTKPTQGEVLAVGPGGIDESTGKKLPVWVQPGMQVLYGKYGGEKIQYNDEEHMLVRDSSVLLSYFGDEPTLETIKMPYGKVLIELKEKSNESEGGLLLSAGLAKPDTTVGKIVAAAEGSLGADGEIVPLELSVGDVVRFRYGSEVELEVDKSEYRVVDASECLAKWKE